MKSGGERSPVSKETLMIDIDPNKVESYLEQAEVVLDLAPFSTNVFDDDDRSLDETWDLGDPL
jgi:hypothetical protein